MSYAPVEPGAVLLLHGVGLDPRLFETMSTMLGSSAVAPLRSPYVPACRLDPAAAAGVERQAAELAAAVAESRDVTVVGVSGGATLALALALLGPPGIVGVIAHEPLVGSIAPDLQSAVNSGAAELDSAAGAEGVVAFLARLIGQDAWNRLPGHAADFARRHTDVVRAEVPQFAAYEPDRRALATMRLPVVITTGSRSHARRHDAAEALARLAPVATTVVEDAGHLAHLDRPAAFADLISHHRRDWTTS